MNNIYLNMLLSYNYLGLYTQYSIYQVIVTRVSYAS